MPVFFSIQAEARELAIRPPWKANKTLRVATSFPCNFVALSATPKFRAISECVELESRNPFISPNLKDTQTKITFSQN